MGACLQRQMSADINTQDNPHFAHPLTSLNFKFSELPIELASDVTCEWLSFEDILRLDSACCNISIRTMYLDAVKRRHLYPPAYMISNFEQLIDWSTSRQALYKFAQQSELRHDGLCWLKSIDRAFSRIKQMAFSDDIVTLHLALFALALLSGCLHDNRYCPGDIMCRLKDLLGHPDIHIVLKVIHIWARRMTGATRDHRLEYSQLFLPAFVPLLSHRDKSVQSQACLALVENLARRSCDLPIYIATGIVAKFVSLLKDPQVAQSTQALQLMRSVINSGNFSYMRYIVDQGVVQPLCALTRCTTNKTLATDAEYLCAGLSRQSAGDCDLHDVVTRQLNEGCYINSKVVIT